MNYLFHPNQKHQELGILKITRIINSNTSTVVRYGRQSSLLPNITLSLPCGTFFSFLALGMISIITKTVTAEVYRFFTPPQNKLARNFWPRAHTTNLSVSSRILSRTAYLFFMFFYFFQEGKHVIRMCAYRSVYLVVFFAGTLHKLVVQVGREEEGKGAGKAKPWGGRGFELY